MLYHLFVQASSISFHSDLKCLAGSDSGL